MKVRKLLFVVVSLFLLLQQSVFAEAKQEKGKHSASSTMKVSFYSEALGQNMRMNVYLPPDYEAKEKYPVLYVLHAYKLNEDHWFQALHITEQADTLIAAGKIEPMIIVAPEIDNSWGMNSADEKKIWLGDPTDPGAWYEGRYEDYVTKDVVGYIDGHFKSDKSRNSRYIGGTSMGGYAALHIGFRNTQLFSKVGGHAPAVFQDELWKPLFDWMYPTEADRNAKDPLRLAATAKLNQTSVYLDCGDLDEFKIATGKLNEILSGRKLKHYEFHLIPGGKHDDAYWSGQMASYLTFYGGMDKK
ncbi:putative esterase [Paenibacillus curdlanolyticus YK9]|uniref:Putative esterase n=1 Tax=Paenibacillus curdlanolyticus YK9 TaxID=717606 RepID=E0I7W5_9BACL|nr:alpha/beta hydrolase-fold protein [Paenibacillus curdlanolyticus]EFM11270.1 putative esterase [Paenibacillus curdlanolyticus YK9]